MPGRAFELPGNAPAVLLIHGFGGTPWEVRPVADALHAEGLACIAPVLPGHGVRPEVLSSTGWMDWTAAARSHAEALCEAHGRVVMLGMSLGGLLALQTAVELQHRGVIGVVTLGCALRLNTVATGVLTLAQLFGAQMPHVFIPKEGSDVRDPTARRRNPGYRVNPLRAAREILEGQRAVRRTVPELRVPLLALHGLRDSTAPLAASLELLERAGSPERSLVVLPRSGHLIAVDHDAAEVSRQVCAFVRRLAAGVHRYAPA